MKSPALRGAAILSLFTWVCHAEVSVWTQHNDNARTGAQLSETILNTTNVNPASFGKLFSLAVDGSVYAQPLYLSGVSIPSSGVHNVLYVATMNDSVYAFDADSKTGSNSSPLWSVHFANPAAGIVPPPSAELQPYDNNISGPVGIISTPVIDRATGTMYVLARTKENGVHVQRLHALDVATGAEKFGGPTAIQGSVPGRGAASVNGVVTFDPKIHNQRPSLALANGNVYIAWASHNDAGAYHGWVMAYSASTLQQTAIMNVTPENAAGGIWQGGQGPSIDSQGNVYYTAGNGSWDGTKNFSESVLKLGPNLSLKDWFTPGNYDELNQFDYDLGSCGLLLLPGTDLMLATGKQGIFYLIKTGGMGHMVPGNSQIVQSFLATAGHVHGGPAYWESPSKGSLIYVWSEWDRLRAFHFNGTTLDTTPMMESAFVAPDGMPGGFLSISANGSAAGSGILWASTPLAGNAEDETVRGIVRAFDASDLSRVLWSSEMNPARDCMGAFAKFVPPVIANGKLYMATFSDEVAVYGLLPSSPDFSLTVAAPSQTAIAGYSATFSIAVAPGSSAVAFTVSGLPPGATAVFRPASFASGTGSNLTIGTSPNTPAGDYPLTIIGAGAQSHSIAVDLTVITEGGPLGPPLDMDIGGASTAGSASISGLTYTVKGAGSDIWATRDQFNFNYWKFSGDGVITARVLGITNTSFYAKAGLMFRETLDPESAFAFAGVLPSLSAFQYRTGTESNAAGTPYYSVSWPYWLRLVRANGNFTAYSSTDGVTWTQTGSSVSIPMAAQVYVGFAVSSNSPGNLNAATFDNVSITGPDNSSGIPDFGLAPLAPELSLFPGTSGFIGIASFPQNGFSGPVSLSVNGAPAGVAASFTPSLLSGSGSASLNVAVPAATPTGVYSLNVTAVNNNLTRITPVTLNIGNAPDFTLSADPLTRVVMAGQSTTFKITPTQLGNFVPIVSLTVSGLPAGATAFFDPGGVSRTVTSTIFITTTAATQAGTYALTFVGSGGGLSHTTTTTLTITAPPDFTLTASPTSRGIAAGSNASFALTTKGISGAAGTVAFTLSGLPATMSASFSPASVDIGSGSVLNVVTSSSTAPSSYSLIVTGTSGVLAHSTTIKLSVTPAVNGTNIEIGTPGTPGTGTLTEGSFSIAGSGSDIWGTSDQFHFNYWTLPADGSITARIVSVTDTSFYAKAGVMLRQSLAANSAYAFAAGLPTLTVFQYRAGTGAPAAGSGYYGATYPLWVRLTRSGGSLTSYRSTDGLTWQQTGSTVSVALSGSVYAGLAVSSQNNAKLNTAVFDNVSIVNTLSSGSGDFALGATPLSQSAAAGSSARFTTQITATNAFAGPVNLSLTSLPAGASAVFSPATISGSGTSLLTINTTAATPAGTYDLNLVGTSGTLTRILPLRLEITSLPGFTLAVSPSVQSLAAGAGTAFTATVTPQNGFNSVVSLGVTGLPAGATAAFSPATVTSGTSTLTVTTAATTPGGTYPLIVTASGGSITNSAPVTLAVVAPDFSLTATPTVQSVTASFGTTWTLDTASLNGASGNVALTIAGLPTGASAWFRSASVPLGSSSVLTVNTSSTTPAGTYPLTVTGTSGALTRTTSLTLNVTSPVDGINLDLGTPGLAGSGALGGGAWTIGASGADVWGTSDQFHFDYWTLAGDGAITARVLSVSNTSFYAKAGLMMRQSLTANSPYAFAAALPSLSVFQYRIAQGASAASSGYYPATYPVWLRLVRSNGNLTAWNSSDGATWQQMGSTVTVPLTGSVFVGFAVSSQNNSKLNTAVFDNLSITGPDARSGAPDFRISAAPLSQTLSVGANTSFTTQITALNGFSAPVTLSASGIPAGAAAVFTPATLTGAGTSTLTISTTAVTPAGTYDLRLAGSSGANTRITPLVMRVQ